MNKYLATMEHNRAKPINHGLVEINDIGFVNNETPIEDFGMWMTSDSPFPPTDSSELFEKFIFVMGKDHDRKF